VGGASECPSSVAPVTVSEPLVGLSLSCVGQFIDQRAARRRVLGLVRIVVSATPDLDRNKSLFWATCRVRDMSATGELDGEATKDALDALRDAALRTGLTSPEINRTISSGMRPRV
jgi:hypothetical protein